jgi:hypothetical protein
VAEAGERGAMKEEEQQADSKAETEEQADSEAETEEQEEQLETEAVTEEQEETEEAIAVDRAGYKASNSQDMSKRTPAAPRAGPQTAACSLIVRHPAPGAPHTGALLAVPARRESPLTGLWEIRAGTNQMRAVSRNSCFVFTCRQSLERGGVSAISAPP